MGCDWQLYTLYTLAALYCCIYNEAKPLTSRARVCYTHSKEWWYLVVENNSMSREFRVNPYKFLWTHIGGRPWTYIVRDLWHKAEFVWIIALIGIGVWLGHNFDWVGVLEIMGIFTIGFIFGHFFWGRQYIEAQGMTNPDDATDNMTVSSQHS